LVRPEDVNEIEATKIKENMELKLNVYDPDAVLQPEKQPSLATK